MGLHREVVARAQPTTASEWEALGHTLWARGRYRESGRAWQLGRAQASEAAQIERAAAVLWIRGQYRKALGLLVDAVPRAAGSEDERLLLAETLARVLDHMGRFPDTRRWVTPELRAFAVDYLPDPDELARRATPVGTHLRGRLRSARRAVGATVSVDDDDDAIASFGEYEALSAQLNYRHGQLRQQSRSGPVDPLQFQLLRRDFETIGNLESAARTVLIGGRAAFSRREIFAAVSALDVTPWHRLRLLVAAYMQPERAR
jgi:hypothetical protein